VGQFPQKHKLDYLQIQNHIATNNATSIIDPHKRATLQLLV